MQLTSRSFWIKAALVTGAIVLPFGSVILLAAAAVKKAQANRRRPASPTNELEEWWKLRALERAAAQTPHRNGHRSAPVPVRVGD